MIVVVGAGGGGRGGHVVVVGVGGADCVIAVVVWCHMNPLAYSYYGGAY